MSFPLNSVYYMIAISHVNRILKGCFTFFFLHSLQRKPHQKKFRLQKSPGELAYQNVPNLGRGNTLCKKESSHVKDSNTTESIDSRNMHTFSSIDKIKCKTDLERTKVISSYTCIQRIVSISVYLNQGREIYSLPVLSLM